MNRRNFLGATAGAAAIALAPAARPATTPARVLRIAPAEQSLAGPAYPRTAVWAYDGTVPGPELRFRQGERLRIEAGNRLEAATTIHWHGVRVPNAMDGVPHLTQPPIQPGGRFLYEFDLPDAGTYWYHPHLGSPEQVGRGLYGALIVEEREPPAVDRDVVWVLSDWRLDRQARIAGDFRSFMDSSHAGRIGNTVTVNGAVREHFAVRTGERIRLRLINASNARIYGLRFEGHEPALIAFDGQPVEPRTLGSEALVLGPAQRADILLDCRADPGSRHRVIDDFYARSAYRLLDLDYSEARGSGLAGRPIDRLAPNPWPRPDVAGAQAHRIVFGGGMMGGMPMQAMRPGLFWTVNGRPVADDGHGHEPLLVLARGRSYRLELVNETAWHHPIHLHGHVFQILRRNEAARGESGDTVLINPRSRAEIAFVADNPGDWMLHCHILEHQVSGMMAVVRVA
jgi:FtsP/CotA-like multicopper oxidase with cupredoxin domain